MRVKSLAASDRYSVVAVMYGEECPALSFLVDGDAGTASARAGLLQMIERVANEGWHNVPAPWSHEADKRNGIYEFIKGPLRLFFFKGSEGQIAVCTGGVRKSGQKADKSAVARAVASKDDYFRALERNTLTTVNES